MRLNDAVDAVTGEVFRDGWTRIRGSMQGLHVAKQRQLIRAAAGHRAAVFKAIRGGGPWTLVGGLGVLTGVCILSYYGVIAGWAFGYIFKSFVAPAMSASNWSGLGVECSGN